MEEGVGFSCCPGEVQIHAAKTRREMQDREALPRLPPSDAKAEFRIQNVVILTPGSWILNSLPFTDPLRA